MWVHRYVATAPLAQPDSGCRVTSAMWRRLLTQPPIAPGSAVLVVGERPLDAIELLVDLAFDVTGWCRDPDAVIQGRRQFPKADFHHWRTAAPPDHVARYDLTLILDSVAPTENLYGSTARRRTAELLGTLKPGGRCLRLVAMLPGQTHTVDCWRRHYAAFPGHWSAQPLQRSRAGWFGGGSATPAWWAIGWRVPEQGLGPEDWLHYAQRALWTNQRTCCPAASEILPLPADLRHAA